MAPISDTPVDMAVENDLFVNSTPITEEPHLASRVYHIPYIVPDSQLCADEIMEEFFRNTKSKLDEYCGTSTLNQAERTITLSRELSRWDPGPALNKNGELELIENRATKLEEVWPEVEATCLYEYGISCNLNLAECSMQVVSTSRFLKDPYVHDRARNLLELLSANLVPPYMVRLSPSSIFFYAITMGDLPDINPNGTSPS